MECPVIDLQGGRGRSDEPAGEGEAMNCTMRYLGAHIQVSRECSMHIMAIGPVTQGGIDKLIAYLELVRGSFPESTESEIGCFQCNTGELMTSIVAIKGFRNGEEFTVSVPGLVCRSCGFTTVDNKQSGELTKALDDAYKKTHSIDAISG